MFSQRHLSQGHRAQKNVYGRLSVKTGSLLNETLPQTKLASSQRLLGKTLEKRKTVQLKKNLITRWPHYLGRWATHTDTQTHTDTHPRTHTTTHTCTHTHTHTSPHEPFLKFTDFNRLQNNYKWEITCGIFPHQTWPCITLINTFHFINTLMTPVYLNMPCLLLRLLHVKAKIP